MYGFYKDIYMYKLVAFTGENTVHLHEINETITLLRKEHNMYNKSFVRTGPLLNSTKYSRTCTTHMLHIKHESISFNFKPKVDDIK